MQCIRKRYDGQTVLFNCKIQLEYLLNFPTLNCLIVDFINHFQDNNEPPPGRRQLNDDQLICSIFAGFTGTLCCTAKAGDGQDAGAKMGLTGGCL